jgi:Na+-transporting NADH:ubiquinone oxidoreductase subunit E
MGIGQFFAIAFSAIFVSNFVLARFLGLCPFIGVTQKTESAIGMGAAVTFVMFLASFVTFLLYRLLLEPANLTLALKTPMFILVIAALVQLVELFMRARLPALYQALGIYLPLITVNCAVFGAVLFMIIRKYTFVASVAYGLGGGLGWMLAIVAMAGIRQKIAKAKLPRGLEGPGISLITAGIMALAFMGFSGMLPAS